MSEVTLPQPSHSPRKWKRPVSLFISDIWLRKCIRGDANGRGSCAILSKPFIWISQKLERCSDSRHTFFYHRTETEGFTLQKINAEDNICLWERKGKKSVFKEGKNVQPRERRSIAVKEEWLHLPTSLIKWETEYFSDHSEELSGSESLILISHWNRRLRATSSTFGQELLSLAAASRRADTDESKQISPARREPVRRGEIRSAIVLGENGGEKIQAVKFVCSPGR